jgi:hypothetical protein
MTADSDCRGTGGPPVSLQDTGKLPVPRRAPILHLCVLLLLLPTGCAPPNQENIRLRKLNQGLDEKLTCLKTEKESDEKTIAGLLKRSPTIPMLSPEELKKMWVTGNLRIGNFSGGVDLDPNKPGDEGFQVFLTPLDENADPIQAAGSVIVEAFDLAEPGDNRLGRWTWDTLAAKSQWRSFLMETAYVLTCPWQKAPKHEEITVRATFTDELTHIPFTAEKVLKLKLPPAGSATVPATGTTTLPK